MPLTCGVTLNLNNLKGDLTTRAQAMLNINMGTPEGLQEIADKIEGELSAIADKISDVVVIPPELKTLRDELADLAALPFAGLEAAAKIVSIAADYLGVTNIRGYTNLNLTDLAKSVFSITGTFDPCSASIPNIALSDGKIMKLPAIQPILGATDAALSVEAPDRVIMDNLGEAIKDNIPIVPSSLPNIQSLNSALESGATTIAKNTPALVAAAEKEVETAKKAIESNVSTAITGMGDMIKKLPTGEPVVETKDNFVERVKINSLSLMDEEAPTVKTIEAPPPALPSEPKVVFVDSGERVYEKVISETPAEKAEKKARDKAIRKKQKERRLRLRKFRKDNSHLSRKEAFTAFYKLPENSGPLF